jgi:RNA polymerase sigma factor for flagellar operon FliA
MNPKSPINHPDQIRLIEKHTPLVKKMALGMVQGLSANVQVDDLIQDGLLGLIDAILRTTKVTVGAEFEHYVAQRARGAMLDGLRANDPGSRQIRRDMRRVELAIQHLGHQLGRAPTEVEVATNLKLPLADYQRLLQDAHGYVVISLHDLGGDDNPDAYLELCASSLSDPLASLERAALRQALSQAIHALPQQEKVVLCLYYEEDLNMREVGGTLGLSESRVSQIHSQAVALMRASFVGVGVMPSLLKPRKTARELA